jgi:hypothetical protein
VSCLFTGNLGFGGLLTNVLGWLASWALGSLAFLVLIIALLVALFRLWIALLTAYVYILIDIVLAPFFILGGLLPGSPVNFEAWLRDMLANLMAFPTTIAMFLLGKVFMETFAGNNNALFIPPLIGTPNDQKAFAALLGIAIVLMTPVVLTMMRELLKAPTFKYASAIGQQISAGTAAPGRIGQGAMNQVAGVHYDDKGGIKAHGGKWGSYARALGFAH